MTDSSIFTVAPALIDLLALPAGDAPRYGLISDGVFEYEGVVQRRAGADSLVVFLPAALMDDPAARRHPSIPRWTWGAELSASYLALSDCALPDELCVGSWFQGNAAHFGADTLAAHIAAVAEAWSIPQSRIVLYGSSMGGFGALMIGARLPEAYVIAEVPQTNLATYSNRAAIEMITQPIYGQSVDRVALQEPDRINVLNRFRRLGAVPRMTIVHDHSDKSGLNQVYPLIGDMLDLIRQRLIVTEHFNTVFTHGRGHVALPLEHGKRLIQAVIG